MTDLLCCEADLRVVLQQTTDEIRQLAVNCEEEIAQAGTTEGQEWGETGGREQHTVSNPDDRNGLSKHDFKTASAPKKCSTAQECARCGSAMVGVIGPVEYAAVYGGRTHPGWQNSIRDEGSTVKQLHACW